MRSNGLNNNHLEFIQACANLRARNYNIQEENIVSEEISADNTEESIAQPMPQLPDLPSDDASSIPVIPVAEPSIDDNDSFNNTDLTSPSQEPSIPSIDIESEENEPA